MKKPLDHESGLQISQKQPWKVFLNISDIYFTKNQHLRVATISNKHIYFLYFFGHYETRFHLDITAITISPGLLSIFSSSDKTPESYM